MKDLIYYLNTEEIINNFHLEFTEKRNDLFKNVINVTWGAGNYRNYVAIKRTYSILELENHYNCKLLGPSLDIDTLGGLIFNIEKKGLIPNTEWKKNALGQSWVLGETIITGIGQGYIQTTPIQLCLMTAQIANGGYKIYPKIVVDDGSEKNPEDKFTPLYENSKNIRIKLSNIEFYF